MTNPKLDEDYLISSGVVDVVRHRIMDVRKDLIFHYCSADTLLIMLEKKTLRFSDARCMNDGEEVVWAHNQIERAIQRLRDRDDVPDTVPATSKRFIDNFQENWKIVSDESRHFLSCFSLTGDSLSQWRAYADDGRGFAVGFCVNDTDVPAKFIKVEYDLEAQQKEIIDLLTVINELFKADKDYFEGQGGDDLLFIFSVACAYKNPAFVDEREVRGSHIVGLERGPSGRSQFEFMGGQVAGKIIEDGKIEYCVAKGRLVPHIDFSFQLESECAIREIWMGPRCATPKEDLEIFLQTAGYGEVIIKTAGSKYR